MASIISNIQNIHFSNKLLNYADRLGALPTRY